MIFTRFWGIALALASTLFLVGLFLLSQPPEQAFSDAEKTALRGVTEGGLVAFEADIASSPVTRVPSLFADARMREALDPKPDDPLPMTLDEALSPAANEGLLKDHPLATVAIVDKSGAPLARTGVDDQLIDELVALDAFRKSIETRDEDIFSAALGGRLFAVKISRKEPVGGRRLVGIAPIDLGGTSFLRRVLGGNPAGLVRAGKVLGDPIGGASAEDLVKVVTENQGVLPPEGASASFEYRGGAGVRLAAIGRVPGPAGRGDDATIFAVLSSAPSTAVDRGMGDALAAAMVPKRLSKVNWIVVGAWFVIALGLALYLPGLEAAGPLRRLAKEFDGLASGAQHQIFADTYGGSVGEVARAAAAAHEAIRVAAASETFSVEGEDEEEEGAADRRRSATRSHRTTRGAGRRTRQHAAVGGGGGRGSGAHGATGDDPQAIELPAMPDDPGALPLAGGPDLAPAAARPAVRAAPAPTLTDEIAEDDDLSLASSLAPGASGVGQAPAPRAAAPKSPPPQARPERASMAPPADPREAHWREVYEEFVATKQACGESTDGFTYDKFAAKLRSQSESLMTKPGVAGVEFNVYVKDGKAALKAKVVKA